MDYRICPMTIAHLPEVMAMENKYFKDPWSEKTFQDLLEHGDNAFCFVMLAEEKVIGYAGLWLVLGEGHVIIIAVEESLRGRGLGRRLMEHLLSIASSMNVKALTLEVRENNISAIRLYERLGFKVEGRRPKYYAADNEDALIMWRFEGGGSYEDFGY